MSAGLAIVGDAECRREGVSFTSGPEALVFAEELLLALRIFDERHKVRGPANIEHIGLRGILRTISEKCVRVQAASDRLYQITAGGGEGAQMQAELLDDLTDVANYALIGCLLVKGKWGDGSWKPEVPQGQGLDVSALVELRKQVLDDHLQIVQLQRRVHQLERFSGF
jgi:hypothetical protein